MTRIELVLDELVLRGLTPAGARVVAQALQERLWALAVDAEGPIAPREEALRRLPPLVARTWAPAQLGDAVANAVWHALSAGGPR